MIDLHGHLADRALFVGQWAPMVGTGLAILGSLYLLLAAEVEAMKETEPSEADATDSRPGRITEGDIVSSPPQSPIDSSSPFRVVSEQRIAASHVETRPDASHTRRDPSLERSCASCGHYHKQEQQEHVSRKLGTGIRGRVAKFILLIGGYLDGDSDPEPPHEEPAAIIDVPGEKHRNRMLSGADGSRSRSRTPSVDRRAVTEHHEEDSSNTTRTGSPQPQSSPRSPSPSSRAAGPRGSAINHVPATETQFDQRDPASASPPAALANRRRSTRDSLHPETARIHSGSLFAATRTSEDGHAEEIEDVSASAGTPWQLSLQ